MLASLVQKDLLSPLQLEAFKEDARYKEQGCQKQFRSGTATSAAKRSRALVLTLIIRSCNKRGLQQQNKYVMGME